MTADSTLAYSKIVERYAHFFDRPEVRLRFLNHTLAQQSASRERADRALSRIGFIKSTRVYDQLLKLWLYHLIFQELGSLLPSASKERRQILRLKGRAPFTARFFFRCYQFRRAFVAVGVLALAATLFGVYTGATWSARQFNGYLASRQTTLKNPASSAGGQYTASAQTGAARHLPDYNPGKVWVVEQKDNFERYSNGARILNDFATENRPRGFYVFRQGEAERAGGLKSEPVGIVYHTSENDMLPFTPDNSASIETRSRGLLEFVRKNKSYNYVIDRFGQIYRIVHDEDAANHAGNSVWSSEQGTYVGLNESFIGVCFETTMEAESTGEQLTEAQLVAGRLLTQVLRSRHHIDDANCVTHGLVSINPTQMLICFHHDWARGFPFEAFGLSDKYRVAPASVAEFGFTADEEVVAKLGGAMWPGVASGEEQFRQRATQAGTKESTLRERMRDAYRQQMELQRQERVAANKGNRGNKGNEESKGTEGNHAVTPANAQALD
jgi:hypothetical protein